jgi:hypothetical protein
MAGGVARRMRREGRKSRRDRSMEPILLDEAAPGKIIGVGPGDPL